MKKVKIFIGMFLIGLILILLSNTSNAASATINASSEATVGESIKISVSGTGVQWNLKLLVNGEEIANNSELENYEANKSISFSGTYAPSSEGTLNVTLVGSVTEVSDGSTITNFSSKTITVKEKEITPEPPKEEKPAETETPTTPETPNNTGTSNTEKPSDTNTPTNSATEEPKFIETNQIVYTTTSLNLRSTWSISSNSVNVPEGTELILTGTSNNTVNNYKWSRVTYNGKTMYVALGKYLTTTKPEDKASNTNLKELKITNVTGLTPAFSKDVKEYTLTVGSDIEFLDIVANAEENKSNFVISGNKDLKIGKNIVTITVNAENGDTSIYQINVTKIETEQLKLSSLSVQGYELSPGFRSDLYEYTLNLKKGTTELIVDAIANKDDAIVEVIGNTDITEGENNIITIMVKSKDGEETATYQIRAKFQEVLQKVENTKNSSGIGKILLTILAVIILIVIGVIAFIFFKNKKGGVQEITEDDFYEELESVSKEERDNFNPLTYFGDNSSTEDKNINNEEDVSSKSTKGRHF